MVDIEAEKSAVNALVDSFVASMKAKDVPTLVSFLAEDGLFLGSDPSEFWNKQQMTELWTQMLADTVPEFTYIRDREIKAAADGHSAIAVDQFMFALYASNIPWRNIYYLVKQNEKWTILSFSSSLIPKNEDLQKLNDALK